MACAEWWCIHHGSAARSQKPHLFGSNSTATSSSIDDMTHKISVKIASFSHFWGRRKKSPHKMCSKVSQVVNMLSMPGGENYRRGAYKFDYIEPMVKNVKFRESTTTYSFCASQSIFWTDIGNRQILGDSRTNCNLYAKKLCYLADHVHFRNLSHLGSQSSSLKRAQ